MSGRRAALAALVITGAACARMGGVRPNITPLLGSVTRTIEASPDAVTRALAASLDSSGVPVEAVAPDEGYVESAWYDLDTRTAHSPTLHTLDHTIKIRFFADPVAGKTRLVAECVRRVIFDPSLPPRELERSVPDSTPGMALMDSVMARVLANQGGGR